MPCVNPTLFSVRSLLTHPPKKVAGRAWYLKRLYTVFCTIHDACLFSLGCKPFFSDAVRIVNDRLLTTLRDQPNDLAPISPSSFLRQELAPNTPMGECHDTGGFAGIICTILPWPIVFGWGGCSLTFSLYRDETNGGSYRKT